MTIPPCFIAVPLLSALLLTVSSAAPPASLLIDDVSLLRQMPGQGIEYRLPERVFPPELVEKLRGTDAVYRKFLYRSIPADASKWTSVPLERWQEMICAIAPVSLEGNRGNPRTMGLSPFTGKRFAGTEMSDEEFLATPLRCREAGTDSIIYAREEDMPADYPARPNHTEMIPHLDGTLHAYRFFVPEGFEDAGPEVGSERKNWFCPAGEVWRCRLRTIMARVIPDLTAAVILEDDAKAVTTLAAVLDRLADIYPGLPLYVGAKAHGFARGPDHKHYLTADEYRSIAPKQPFINVRAREDYPSWYVDIYDFSFDKLHGGVSAWTDGVVSQMGWIASAFDLIRDRPGTAAFSQAKHGTPDAWERRFRERCLTELEFLALATPPTTGNTSYAYITGSAMLGIACQNAALFRKSLEIIELYLYSNWSADGMAADAAFNYAMMTQSGILGLSWMTQFFGGVDLAERYPLKRTIDQLGTHPIKTLYDITSKHADEHSLIFRGRGDPPAELAYAEHEASQCLPFYGMTALRGGAPGHRLELIVNHQNAAQHAHRDRLSYQLFYEGIDCLPDFGYCIGFIDPGKKPWSDVHTGYELMGLPNEDTDRWGPWKWGYADRPEAHGVLMVDHWLYRTVPCQLHAYVGAATMDDPGWWAQFADTSAASLFLERPNPVDIYRRQIVVLTLPGGNPVVVDVFRVRGGARHDLFWHVPGDRPTTMPSAVDPIEAPNWSAYTGQKPNYDRLTGKALHHYGKAGRLITNLQRYALPRTPWYSEWLIQPARTFPEPEAYRQTYGAWTERLHDVRLGMWSYTTGSAATSEMVCGRGPYPGGLPISDPESGKTITTTVGLKDALDYRILTREADAPGLESVFVHALEARNQDQVTELAEFAVDPPQPLAAGGGIVCRLQLVDGTTGILASTLNCETIDTPALVLTGRMAALFPQANRLALVDGTVFRAEGWQLDLDPSWEMSLTSVVGDLTGEPLTSALVVTSARALPTDGTLVGHLVTVWHGAGGHGQSVYTVAGVSRLDRERWRIDLLGNPPFIIQRARVLKVDPDDPCTFEQDFQFHQMMGQTNVTGRRIRFPRSGFETSLVETGRSSFSVMDAPPDGAVTKGDAFVVYGIRTGDRVVIPSRFACTGTRDVGDTLSLSIATTGTARLTLPGAFRQAITEAGAIATNTSDGNTALTIEPTHLTDGHGVVRLGP